jgi:hypothetical protein
MLDLPSYANRVTQRSRRLGLGVDLYPYVMVAGRSEFKSLPLNPNINTDSSYVSKGVEQLFFTTLERQYSKEKSIELQQFHWLFVTKTPSGWRLVMMFSQAGEYPLKSVISPPRNSSNGVIAQAVKLWLRDCQAASLRS